MGEISKALATPAEFEFRGETYRMAPLKAGLMGEYEEYLERGAWEAAKRSRKFLTDEEYKQRLDGVVKLIASKQLSFLSDTSLESQKTLEGFTQLVFLRLRPNHPEIKGDAGLTLVREMVEEMLDDLKSTMDRLDADPNLKAPEATATGANGTSNSPPSAPVSSANPSA